MTPFDPDLYERLGLSPEASAQQIRRQFRLLARLYHPDKRSDDESARLYLALQEAYRVLNDDTLRDQYDRWRRSSTRGSMLDLRLQSFPTVLRSEPTAQRLYVLATISPPLSLAQRAKLPLNLVLVLDRSNSMRGQRLHYVREAARKLVATLRGEDCFGLVTFNDRATSALPSGPVSQNVGVAYAAIDSIQAVGGTEIAEGLREAYQAAMANHRPDGLSHILLLTDGRTYGDEVIARDMVIRGREMGIGLSAFGLGTDWNDELLDELATLGGGSCHYIAIPQDAVTHFQARVGQLQQTLSSDATVRLNVAEGMTLLRAHEVTPGLRLLPLTEANTISLGTLAAEPPMSLLLEFRVEPQSSDVIRLLDLSVDAPTLGAEQRFHAENFLVLERSEGDDAGPSGLLYQAVHRVETLVAQQRAWQAIRGGKPREAVQALGQLAGRFREVGADELGEAVERELTGLRGTGKLTAEGTKAIKYGTRRLALPAPVPTESAASPEAEA